MPATVVLSPDNPLLWIFNDDSIINVQQRFQLWMCPTVLTHPEYPYPFNVYAMSTLLMRICAVRLIVLDRDHSSG